MLNPDLLAAYRDARRPHFADSYRGRPPYVATAESALQQARYALAAAETRKRWSELDGRLVDGWTADRGDFAWRGRKTVRIVERPDEHADIDGLAGQTFDPDANPGINPNVLKREREAFVERVNSDGVWGYVAEYWDGAEWQHADSVWGFVADDFLGSGYAEDLMAAAMDAYAAAIEAQARTIEAERPDMYATA